MSQFTLDLRQANRLDPNSLRFRPVSVAPRQQLPPEAKPALKAGLELGAGFDSRLALLNDVASLSYGTKSARVLRPASQPKFALSASAELTMTLGFTAWGFAFYGAGGTVAAYASTTREIGWITSTGVGVFLGSPGISGGVELGFVLGRPADLSGPFLAAGVSVAPGVLGVGAALLFSPGPPLTLMGVSVSVTANTPSVVPVTVTLEFTNTSVPHPLLSW